MYDGAMRFIDIFLSTEFRIEVIGFQAGICGLHLVFYILDARYKNC